MPLRGSHYRYQIISLDIVSQAHISSYPMIGQRVQAWAGASKILFLRCLKRMSLVVHQLCTIKLEWSRWVWWVNGAFCLRHVGIVLGERLSSKPERDEDEKTSKSFGEHG